MGVDFVLNRDRNSKLRETPNMNNPQVETNQIAQADILASLSYFQPVSKKLKHYTGEIFNFRAHEKLK